jgi:hypothetical protein
MNPLAPTKCASRTFMLLAAISGIILSLGCGSSNNGTPNNNGFTNSNFTGTYVISMAGTDYNSSTFSLFAIVGTVTADGNGNITGGTVDINDQNIGGVFTGQALSKSNYSVNQDGRGTLTLITPQGNFGADFVLSSNNHGLITRFDTTGTGSGTIDTQGTAPEGSLGAFAFTLSGSDASQNSLGSVGGFTLDGSGNITTGVQDVNDNGSAFANLPLTGTVVLSSSTFGTATLNTDFGSLLFDVWVIDSTHLKLIETDTSGLTLSGDAFTQITTFTAGQLVYTLSGVDDEGDPVVAGGYVTTDTNGNLSAGLEDFNNAGSTGTVQPFSATCNASAPFAGGRCQLATTTFTNGITPNLQFAAYPTTAGVLMLENDGAGFFQGAAYNQTATAFTPPAGYGLNLTGLNFDNVGDVAEVDDIAQFNATTTASPATNMTGVLDENSILNGGPVSNSALSGNYAPDSPATGRGAISVTTPKTFIGILSLEYYVVNASTVLIIEGDQDQLSVGTYELQNTPSGQAMVQQQQQAHVIPIIHPFVKPHNARRQKK